MVPKNDQSACSYAVRVLVSTGIMELRTTVYRKFSPGISAKRWVLQCQTFGARAQWRVIMALIL